MVTRIASSRLANGTLRQPALRQSLIVKRNASGGGGYNEPSGYLFAEKPTPPGQKRQKGDWENIWYFGMFGGLALGAVLYVYKPKEDIGSWAEKEARKRLDERGEWRYKPAASN